MTDEKSSNEQPSCDQPASNGQPASNDQPAKQRPNTTIFHPLFRWCWRGCKFLLALILFYLFVVLLGLIPVNRDFVATENGVEIFVTSTPVHSDIIVPIQNDVVDWGEQFPDEYFERSRGEATHIAFGWGDRGFYIETPTWADMKTSTALNALFFPSETVMHVGYTFRPAVDANTRSVRISSEQYKKLADFVNESFKPDSNGQIQPIPNSAYGSRDAFFIADGNYHCFQTCNCWTGNALEETGIKTGWFTPLPKTVFWYFPQ